MDADRYARLRALHHELVDRSADERAAALAGIDDHTLRTELEALLADDADGDDGLAPLDERAIEAAAVEAGVAGLEIPGYRITGLLGAGGMGAVYAAEQLTPRRAVAIKLLRSPGLGDAAVRRFQREAEALGRLEHPGVARIYETGMVSTRGGEEPFIAMELVRGLPIDAWVAAYRPDVRTRLQLVADVCEAIAAAHAVGVVHRDLKPANILVEHAPVRGGTASGTDLGTGTGTEARPPVATSPGRSGDGRSAARPRVLDFGVAQLTGATHAATLLTAPGGVVGTLGYMAPEQLTGAGPAGAASDVYALGVLVYELLTGHLPVDVSGLGVPEAARRLTETTVPSLATVDTKFRGDVATIVAKAMDPDPKRRYATADELGDDITRYLSDQPITARPASAAYRTRKFVRRNRTLVGATAAVIGVLAASTVALGVLLVRTDAARDDAVAARQLADDARDAADAARREEAAARQAATEAQVRAERELERSVAYRDFLFEDLLPSESTIDLGVDTPFVDVLRQADGRVDARFGDDPEIAGRLHRETGVMLLTLGDFPGSVEALERSVALLTDGLGPDASLTLQTKSVLAEALGGQGRWAEAETIARQATEEFARREGADATSTIQASIILADTLQVQHRHAEARPILESVIASRELGDPLMTQALQALGGSLIATQEFVAAEPVMRRMIASIEAQDGVMTARLSSGWNNLADCLIYLKKYDEASAAATRSAEIARATLPEDHPSLGYILNTLGTTHAYGGRPVEAAVAYREAFDVFAASRGLTDYLTVRAMRSYVLQSFFSGVIDDGLTAGAEYERRKDEAGLGWHQEWIEARMDHSMMLRDSDRLDEAITRARATAAFARQHLPPDNERHAQAAGLIASLEAMAGD